MKPPYEITPTILKKVASISEKLGEVNAANLERPATELRKLNRIKTIQSSLEIEGNTLTVEQITALLNNTRILGPKKDILEVQNAIATYEQLPTFQSHSIESYKKAHRLLMNGLVEKPGTFRTSGVGIVKGSQVAHIAPSGEMVNGLMKDLFSYLKNENDLTLIKSCVFHYEMEFIHPFTDGNGRMGRLWQTVILMEKYPVFEFLPVESIIKQRQTEYYTALSTSDNSGSSTPFIEFMLEVIEQALDELLKTQKVSLTSADRMDLFKRTFSGSDFTRKDYLLKFKNISSATASRDLREAVEKGFLLKAGDKRNTIYRFK